MRWMTLSLIGLFIAACNGVNSSMSNSEQDPPAPIVTKPGQCVVDFEATCWRQTIAKVTACLNDLPSSKETFSEDRKFCSSGAGKIIAFDQPNAMFHPHLPAAERPIQFEVYPLGVESCFRVSGTADKFEIYLHETGQTASFERDEEQMTFTCLDGQSVSIPAEKISSCEKDFGGEANRFLPGLMFSSTQTGGAQGWAFRFRGAPESPNVFRCALAN